MALRPGLTISLPLSRVLESECELTEVSTSRKMEGLARPKSKHSLKNEGKPHESRVFAGILGRAITPEQGFALTRARKTMCFMLDARQFALALYLNLSSGILK